MKCANCHFEYSNSKFCPECGTPSSFFCSKCGHQHSQKYCPDCGQAVSEITQEKKQSVQQPQIMPQPQIVINNAASSSASSSSSAGGFRGYAPPYPRNSIFVHFILLMFTAGIGNLIYFLSVKHNQSKWRSLYR